MLRNLKKSFLLSKKNVLNQNEDTNKCHSIWRKKGKKHFETMKFIVLDFDKKHTQ